LSERSSAALDEKNSKLHGLGHALVLDQECHLQKFHPVGQKAIQALGKQETR
jgi:hypothetical protein